MRMLEDSDASAAASEDESEDRSADKGGKFKKDNSRRKSRKVSMIILSV